ncbi:MAG: cytochrome c oxidase subunit I [Firmicutes bacterium]|nr:cytochrome c oxidase subunit I [Bacillota bacterium]
MATTTLERSFWQALPKPRARTGFWSWVTTVDHKRIGILYFWTALAFFLIGGVEALLIRLQLARPEQDLVAPDLFNQLFTMHATTMIFLAIMPLTAAFFNYFIPLLVGARDVAFPKLNALSYWMFLAGGIFLNSSWVLGGPSDAGWFGYPNYSLSEFNPGLGVDFWIIGLLLAGIGTLVSGFNFIVTILNMRAPGMSLMRMPMFAWATLVTSFLIVFSFPVITVALLLLLFDRVFGTVFFDVFSGADLTLYHHLFWVFGHPEVYIIVLPAMGIVSEVLPVFSRKPLFGYSVMVFSTMLIGFVGFGVWSHHLFTVGMGPVVNTIFSLATMIIAVPTGIKMFNWIGTLFGGRLRFTAAMLYSLGFLALFLIGGLTGVMLSAAPSNTQIHHTYFVVGHFHYVMIGGALFSLMSALHYWGPKMFGRMLDERLGKVAFWTLFVGFNLTFFPMNILGVMGMPRRIYTYSAGMGWDGLNATSTLGALIMAVSILITLYNLVTSLRNGERAPADPWDGRTLEWAIPSPAPEYNFARLPNVSSRDELWVRKHPQLAEGAAVAASAESDGPAEPIAMPGGSYMPLLVSLGLFIAGYGLLYSMPVFVGGIVLSLLGLIGWGFEGDNMRIIQPGGEQ